MLLDLSADWSVATTYLNGPGLDNHLRQTNNTAGVSYFLTDHLGSTAGLTDSSGSLLEQHTYDSFGNSTGSARTRYGYTGRERDLDTGQLYYRARFYDAQEGRFISEDPIRLAGGINLYAYVRNNSLLYNDPSGLRRCHPLLGALAGGMIGTGAGGLIGGALGGGSGAAIGGGMGTLFAPGVGTLVGGGGGAAVGGLGGAGIGAIVGGGVGAGLGYLFCLGGDDAIPAEDTRPKDKCDPDEGDRQCMIQWENDNSVCRILPTAAARARCYASANSRLGACLAKRIPPPLDTGDY